MQSGQPLEIANSQLELKAEAKTIFTTIQTPKTAREKWFKAAKESSQALMQSILALDYSHLYESTSSDVNYKNLTRLMQRNINTGYIIIKIEKDKHHPLKTHILKLGQSNFKYFKELILDLFLRAITHNKLLFLKNFLPRENHLEMLIATDILNIISTEVIFLALLNNQVEIVKFLIECGITYDKPLLIGSHYGHGLSKSYNGLTPLHAAIKMNNKTMVELICVNMREANLSFEVKAHCEESFFWSYTPIEYACKLKKTDLAEIIQTIKNKYILLNADKAIEHYNTWSKSQKINTSAIDLIFLDQFTKEFSKEFQITKEVITDLISLEKSTEQLAKESKLAKKTLQKDITLSSKYLSDLENATKYLMLCIEFAKNRSASNKIIDIDTLTQLIIPYLSKTRLLAEKPSYIIANYMLKKLNDISLSGAQSISEEDWEDILIDMFTVFEISDPISLNLAWNSKLPFIYPHQPVKDSPFEAICVREHSHQINIETIITLSLPVNTSRITELTRIDCALTHDDDSRAEHLEYSVLRDIDATELNETETKTMNSESKLEANESTSVTISSSFKINDKPYNNSAANIDIDLFDKANMPNSRNFILQCLGSKQSQLLKDSKNQYSDYVISDIDVLICYALNHKDEGPLSFLIKHLPNDLLTHHQSQQRWQAFVDIEYVSERSCFIASAYKKARILASAGLFADIEKITPNRKISKRIEDIRALKHT